MSQLPWIPANAPPVFPDPAQALDEPNGLLAAGGDLSVERLLAAYRRGIFPWFDDQSPILWWSPDPRLIIQPGTLHISRRLRRTLRKLDYQISFDRDFSQVIHACADSQHRAGQDGTWITTEMIEAYEKLHGLGHAHSIEVWRGSELIGGLYGIAIGLAFFGESMFSRRRDGSKIAMAWLDAQLADWQFVLMDCQVSNPHLISMGALKIRRITFLDRLETATASHLPVPDCPWSLTVHPDFLD